MPDQASASVSLDPRYYGNVAGNHYDKYRSKNAVARRLVAGFMREFDSLVRKTGARTAHEIGCGEGEISLRLLNQGIDARGMDVDHEMVAVANRAAQGVGRGDRFNTASIYDLPPHEIAADLIVCCEVLEHLPDPLRALDILAKQRADYWLFSVPREPIWRILNLARGSYVRQLGNTPGHIQHWSARSFAVLVSTRFEVLELRKPLPWSMALCRARGR